MMEVFRRAHEHQGARVRRDLPELQRLQRRRVRGDHRQGSARRHAHRAASTASRSASAPTASAASCSTSSASARSSRSPTSARTRLLVHDEHRDDPALAFALSRLVVGADDAHARSACSATSTRPDLRGRGAAPARRARRSARAPATSPSSSAPAPPGKSTRRDRVSSVVEAAEHHAGARLGREERRLLRHAHARRRRRRGSCRR